MKNNNIDALRVSPGLPGGPKGTSFIYFGKSPMQNKWKWPDCARLTDMDTDRQTDTGRTTTDIDTNSQTDRQTDAKLVSSRQALYNYLRTAALKAPPRGQNCTASKRGGKRSRARRHGKIKGGHGRRRRQPRQQTESRNGGSRREEAHSSETTSCGADSLPWQLPGKPAVGQTNLQ